ncbi:MAG: hypothetical protein QOE90_1843 [Thermoplasmata archaeon]|jgi:hypothetical protein|nr:hypothetical protein [Thermoplasmata archaeon]
MPTFLDTHSGTELPSELRRMVEARVKSGEKDSFGVVDRGIIIDREGNEMHCLLDAPDANAIVKHHEALKVPLARETIHRADTTSLR